MYENLALSSPDVSPAPSRSSAAPQLLIDMPAESAARLLARSLLEQVAQLSLPSVDGPDVAPWVPLADVWRVATDRLSACVTLYADVLTGSFPRKTRRRLRALSDESDRLHRAEVQLSWLGRFVYAFPRNPDSTAVGRDDVAAATWLRQRVMRRRARARAALERAHRDVAQLRRLAKRLGVYTTAVRLDDMPLPRSFATLTGELVLAGTERLRKDLGAMSPTQFRSVRRALRASRRLTYLLEPVRVHVDGVAAVSERLRALQVTLERLADIGAIASAILRAGRRAGALHMTELLRVELSRKMDQEAIPPDSSGALVPPNDFRPGLLALARQLRAEVTESFEGFRVQWDPEEVGGLTVELEACAERLARS